MKVEFKWIVSVEIEVEDDGDESSFEKAELAYERAKNFFYESLDNDEDTGEIVGFDINNEEDK